VNPGTGLTDLATIYVIQFADEVCVRPSCIHDTLRFNVELVACNKLLSAMYIHRGPQKGHLIITAKTLSTKKPIFIIFAHTLCHGCQVWKTKSW